MPSQIVLREMRGGRVEFVVVVIILYMVEVEGWWRWGVLLGEFEKNQSFVCAQRHR